jgi:transposase
MHKIEEILRLRYEADLSLAQIARACGVSKGVVSKYLRLAQASGIIWPYEGDTEPLHEVLMPKRVVSTGYVEPDYAAMHQELKRKGVTLQLLWSEYAADHGDHAYRYSRYCERYRQWRAGQRRSMRQRHLAGEKLFIDYAGPTVGIVNRATGEVREAQIFVAVMGASSYTYAEATWTQSLPDWIASHQRAFRFFGGTPKLIVPDNLKSAVTKASRYEPVINDTYQEMARHYRTAILPARPYKPKDKSKAEIGVQVVERWILARLRDTTLFSLAELNRHIRDLLASLNERAFQKLPGSRRSQFETLDLPALNTLPDTPYTYADWKKAKVGVDYPIEVDKHYYSVPHRYVGQIVDVRSTAATVECLQGGKRITSHPRVRTRGYTTSPDHMPAAHRAHRDWSPQRFLRWAAAIGPNTHAVVEGQLTNYPHPEHGYRKCLGLLNNARRYGAQRLEAACGHALHIGSPSYRSVTSILKQGLDRASLPESEDDRQRRLPSHDNVRGAEYYRGDSPCS